MTWIFALDDKSISNNGLKLVNVAEKPVLLVKKEGKAYAISNTCPHLGCPLSAGTLDGFALKCPCHDWRFDVRTGEFIDAPEVKIAKYDVKIEKGKIYVNAEVKK
jgi:nitrite reductase/ring-hydroxylating ferredoxin subunit